MTNYLAAGWLQSLTVTEHIFFWIAVVATALLIVQIILLLVSFAGGGDIDADGDFDMDGDISTDGGQNADGKTSTANFLSGLLKSLPPLEEVYNMAGLSLPNVVAPQKAEEEQAEEE